MNPKVRGIKDPKGKQKTEPGPAQKQLIMMIDDRTTGVDSRIKQHLRYGGTWKQDRKAKQGIEIRKGHSAARALNPRLSGTAVV